MNHIDCDEIQNWVSRASEEYQSVCKRFEELDPALTLLDIARAYVGYAYTDEFDSLDLTCAKVDLLIANHQLENAFNSAWESHCKNPFNLAVMDSLMKLLPQDHEIWKVVAWRYLHLVKAIGSTGDGKTPETAFCVTSVADEYIVIHGLLELENAGRQQLRMVGDHPYDVIAVTPAASFAGSEVFFDIQAFFAR